MPVSLWAPNRNKNNYRPELLAPDDSLDNGDGLVNNRRAGEVIIHQPPFTINRHHVFPNFFNNGGIVFSYKPVLSL